MYSNKNKRKSHYKKKESYIEYHFSNNIGKNTGKPYLDIEIPIGKIQKIFDGLRKRFGENELIKEYSSKVDILKTS